MGDWNIIILFQVGKEDTEEKRAVLAEIEKLKEKEETIKKMIEKLSDNDPEVIDKISKRAEVNIIIIKEKKKEFLV